MAMRTHWSTLANTIEEVEAVGDTRRDAHVLVDTLADPVLKVDAVTLRDTRSDADELVETLADMLAEVEAVGDTRGDAHALVDTG